MGWRLERVFLPKIKSRIVPYEHGAEAGEVEEDGEATEGEAVHHEGLHLHAPVLA